MSQYQLSGWRDDLDCPSAERHVVKAFDLAREAGVQHPLSCRLLSIEDRIVAIGGVVEICAGDGLAFVWVNSSLPAMAWRRILPHLSLGLWSCHERGVRRVSAVVSADHARALRLIKRLGFSFVGVETGFAGTIEPMLRYVHCWPAFDEPALVMHQCRELELACFAAWCPELAETETWDP